jgi:ABC-type antimicrobial peptide transport system ATPase subunit
MQASSATTRSPSRRRRSNIDGGEDDAPMLDHRARSSHEMAFAADIADRVLMFDQGRIVEEGPPDQVLKAPQNPRTRQFLRAALER